MFWAEGDLSLIWLSDTHRELKAQAEVGQGRLRAMLGH